MLGVRDLGAGKIIPSSRCSSNLRSSCLPPEHFLFRSFTTPGTGIYQSPNPFHATPSRAERGTDMPTYFSQSVLDHLPMKEPQSFDEKVQENLKKFMESLTKENLKSCCCSRFRVDGQENQAIIGINLDPKFIWVVIPSANDPFPCPTRVYNESEIMTQLKSKKSVPGGNKRRNRSENNEKPDPKKPRTNSDDQQNTSDFQKNKRMKNHNNKRRKEHGSESEDESDTSDNDYGDVPSNNNANHDENLQVPVKGEKKQNNEDSEEGSDTPIVIMDGYLTPPEY